MSARRRRYWMGIDGEGCGRAPHRYVLLAASTADGQSYTVEDNDGLRSEACLRFLVSLPKLGRVAGYYLSYDWTMMLRDLPDASIYRLLRPELRALPREEGGGFTEVRWRGFRLHWLAGMMRVGRGSESVTVWDLGKYYQSPFVDALGAWQIAGVDLERMRAMKAERSEFRALTPAIRRYCLDECRALADLATQLEDAHESIGLRPPAWHGPGSTAGAAMKRMRIHERRGEHPSLVNWAADLAFFGGRFEHRAIGTFRRVYGRDIASAYPYHAYHLPCLEHARWTRVLRESKLEGARQALVHFRIRDIGNMPWGPLPIRLASGNIVFPRSGASGWCYLEEWQAARAGWDGLEFIEAYRLYTDCDCQPFAPILEWYRERVRIGKNAKGRTLKLLMNSIPGKLAQTIGKPQFACRLWTGMVNSGTRAQLLRAMCAHSSLDAVLGVATDGIFATEFAKLEPSRLAPETLGTWEGEPDECDTMTFVRPGVYWSHNRDPKERIVKARGLGKRKLDAQRALVLAAIDAGETGKVDLGTSQLFGGARVTIYRTPSGELRRSRFYGEWHDAPARISLGAEPKRRADWSLHQLPDVESAPYMASEDGLILEALGDLFAAMR